MKIAARNAALAVSIPLSGLAFSGCATPLMKAAAAGDNAQVEAMVGSSNQKQKNQALYSAVYAAKLETVQLLLSKGASPNADSVVICPAEKQNAVMSLLARSQDMPMQAPVLVTAAHAGNLKIMEALLDAGADINGMVKKVMQWPCNNYTSLIYGVRDNNPEVVRLLLDRGANLQARGGRLGGHTALEWAQKWGSSPDILAMLQNSGTENASDRKARAEAAKKKAQAELEAQLRAAGVTPAQPAPSAEPVKPAEVPKPKPVPTKALDSQL